MSGRADESKARGKPWPKRKSVEAMTPTEQAAYLARRARKTLKKHQAVEAMTPEQRADYEAAETLRRTKAGAGRRERRSRALVELAEWVDALPRAGDLPLNPRETAARQGPRNMLGTLLLDFPRDKGGRALAMLREWNGRLRVHCFNVFTHQGRPVRSAGWTLRLYETTADGNAVPSTRELDAEIAALLDLRARLLSDNPVLLADIAAMRAARELWEQESAANGHGESRATVPDDSATLPLPHPWREQLPRLDVERGRDLGNPIERRTA